MLLQHENYQSLEFEANRAARLGFIGLQVPNDRPIQISEIAHRFPLVVSILSFVLSELPASGFVG